MLLKPCARKPSRNGCVTRGLPHAVSSVPIASKVLPRFHPGCIAATADSADKGRAESAAALAPPAARAACGPASPTVQPSATATAVMNLRDLLFTLVPLLISSSAPHCAPR